MRSLKEIKDRLKRGPVDLVGLDLDPSGLYAVRMHKNASEVTLLAAEILPPLALPKNEEEPLPPLALPPKLKAGYACLCVPAEGSVVKLLSFPGRFDQEAEAKVVPSMGLADANQYRIGYKLISEGHGRGESRVLSVALPEDSAAAVTGLLPAGRPAVYSLEIAPLAVLSAFLRARGGQHAQETVGAIHFGAATTSFLLLHQGNVALVRLFDFGVQNVMDSVRQSLGLDSATAASLLADASFDLSQPISEAMQPFLKQIIASRDFVERRENCHLSRIYMSGGLRMSRDCVEVLRSLTDVETWDPFEGCTVARDAIPPAVAGENWRFAAAVGACVSAFEES